MPRLHNRAQFYEMRRQQLMDAAHALLLEQGLAKTGIEQITARAGVAKGTFYIYFESKQSLLEELQTAYMQRMLKKIEQTVHACDTEEWQEIVTIWASTTIDFYMENHQEHSLLFDQSPFPLNFDSGQELIIGTLADILEKRRAPGTWTSKKCYFIAAFFYHGMHGVLNSGIQSEKESNPALRKLLLDIVTRSLAPSALPE